MSIMTRSWNYQYAGDESGILSISSITTSNYCRNYDTDSLTL